MNSILYLPTRYFPSISGAEFYFQRMAETLTGKFNYKIDVYTSNALDFKALRNFNGKTINYNDKYFNKVNNLKIKRFPINYDLSETEKLNQLKSISAYKVLEIPDECIIKYLKNGPYLEGIFDYLLKKPNLNYDLIHSTFFPYFNIILSLIIGNLYNIPTVCTPFFHFSNPRYSDIELIEALKKFDLLIACTHLEKDFLIKNYKIHPNKINVIPMGVDFKKFKNFNKKSTSYYHFKQKFFDKKEQSYKLVLFCGNKNYEKGTLSILKAIPYILKKHRKVYFVFIGPSTMAFNKELSRIQKLENVRIINFTPDNLTGYFDKKKISAFKEADIYLMPSRSDAFGISFLEAWAAGKPVVGAKIGATPEVIQEGVDGLLVDFDNPKDIAQKVITLLKHKRIRRKFGLAGQDKVYQKYTWNIIANITHNTYQNLIFKLN